MLFKSKVKRIPFWEEEVKPYKEQSLFWHRIWMDNGRPKSGYLADIHRSTRSQYHKAVKLCQSKDSVHRKQRMAESLQNNTGRDIWRELKKLKPCNKLHSRIIDGKTDIVIGVSRGGGVLTPLFLDPPFSSVTPPPPTQADLTDKCNVNCFLIV